jgi:hypothetical protein
MHAAGRLISSSFGQPARLGLQRPCLLLSAGGAFASEPRWRSDGELGSGHPHDMVGDAVSLMFQRVVDLPDNELRLYRA